MEAWNSEAGLSKGGEELEKMRGSEANLTTVAKISKESGFSAGVIRKAVKEARLEPALVKAGCSYYDKAKLDTVVKKIKKT